MATFSNMKRGYGFAAFSVGGDSVTVIANSLRLKIVVVPAGDGVPLTGEWRGANALAVGAAVCNGHMTPAILADFCDENTPTTADSGLRAGELLRRAV